MPFIDRSKPSASALLKWALTNHGNVSMPPLRDRSMAAYQQLESFVRMLAATDASTTLPAPATNCRLVQGNDATNRRRQFSRMIR